MGPTVDRFGVPVTFRATGAPTKDANGYNISGATTDTAGKMAFYPTPGHRRETLPQGLQDGDIQSGGTTTVVVPATEGGVRGTEVIWSGKTFEVVQVQHYVDASGSGGYYEVEMRRVFR